MRTALISVTEPEPFINLEDAKAHLRVDSSDEDDLIKALIAAACATIDGGDGQLKRAIGSQKWKLVLPCFPGYGMRRQERLLSEHPHRHSLAINIPLPPTVSIESIKYYDGSNTEQTLTADQDYWLIDCGSEPGYVIPTTSWPSCYRRPNAVTVEFTAGYPDGKIPAPIIAAAKLMLGHLYANREAVEVGTLPPAAFPMGFDALLFPYRILA